MEEIDGFILVNRILTNKDLKELKKIIINNSAKGIVFDDIGIIELLKDINITKILMLNHIANNYVSINYYLDYVDSVVVSNDITKEEIEVILDNAKKPLVLNVFGLNSLLYSRRLLISNYNDYYDSKLENCTDLFINEYGFTMFENEFGTVIYAKKYYNGLELIPSNNVLYYWYNPVFLDKKKVLDIVINKNIDSLETSNGFLYQKTMYKLKDGDNK